jgi:hypothetical protein
VNASDRLFAAIMALSHKLDALPNTAAVRRNLGAIALDVATGRYSDFRTSELRSSTLKAQLVFALTDATPDAIANDMADLCGDILAGNYADAPPVIGEEPLIPGEMSAVESKVFTWLYRYMEVYGQSPTMQEIAANLEMERVAVSNALRSLFNRGVLNKTNGTRCWVPTMVP